MTNWHIDEGVKTLRYDRHGQWWTDDEKVRNAKIALLFSRYLEPHEDGWRVHVGGESLPAIVEDTPWHVNQIYGLEDGGPVEIELNDESREPLDLDAMSVGTDHALYCRVKEGKFEARLKRGAWQQLVPLLEEGREGEPVIKFNGRRHRLTVRTGR